MSYSASFDWLSSGAALLFQGVLVIHFAMRRWRFADAIRWSLFVPYLTLYLATVMFYWWPLARISGWLWLAATVFFIAATILNIGSHSGSAPTATVQQRRRAPEPKRSS